MEDYLKRLLDILLMGEFFERVFDFFSFLLLVISIPLFFIIAILIKIDSKRFFLQKRCGRNRKEFFMYKFRTMVKDAETLKKGLKNEMDGPMFKLRNDPRITWLGKDFEEVEF